MGVIDEATISRIKSLLRHRPKGMMISDLSHQMKINRNIMAKYLEILQMAGQVEMETRGNAKVYALSKRAPLSALFESSSDCILLLDETGKILWVNTPVLTLSGKKTSEIEGRQVSEIDNPFFAHLPHGEAGETSDTVAEISFEQDGEVKYYRVKKLPAVLSDGSNGSILSCEDITSEVVFQQMVERSEARFRAIVEDQTEFIARYLPDGRITFVNGSCARFFGKRPEEMFGGPFFSLFRQQDGEVLRARGRSLDPDNPHVIVECHVSGSDGVVRRQEWTVRALFDNESRIAEYQVVGRDITDQAMAAARIDNYLKTMEFLSQTGKAFMDMGEDEDMYGYIARQVYSLAPGFLVWVGILDPEKKLLRLRGVAGNPVAMDTMQRATGMEVRDMVFPIDKADTVRLIRHRSLVKTPPLFRLLHMEIPEDICRQIEETAGGIDSYLMGLVSKGTILGDVGISIPAGSELPNRELIEAFIQQAAIAIEKKIAEDILKESERLYRSVLDNIQDVYYRSDTDGCLVMASPSWAAVLGYDSLDECIGKNIADMFHLEPAAREKFLDTLYHNGEVRDYELDLKRKDGRPVFVAVSSHLLRDNSGTVLGIEGIFRDITKRHRAEEKNREHLAGMEFLSGKAREFLELSSEAEIYDAIGRGLSGLVPDAAICVSSCDPSSPVFTIRNVYGIGGRETFRQVTGTDVVGFSFTVNDPAAFGLIKTSILHKAYGDLYNGLFGQVPYLICKQLEEVLHLGQIYFHGLVSRDQVLGCATIFLRTGQQLPEPDLIEAFIQQSSLVLAWRRADDAVRRSEARFRAIIEDQTEFVTRFLPDGTLTYVNRSYSQYLGEEPGNLIGQPHIPYIISEVIPLLQQRSPASGPDDLVTTVQFHVTNPAGTVRWQQWTIRALCNDADEIREFQSIGKDITEIHEAEEKMRQYIADMEFLSRKAQEFLELPADADIFHVILDGLRELVPDSIITVSSFDYLTGSITTRSVWSEEVGTLFRQLTGESLVGKVFRVSDPDAIINMKTGRIRRIPGDIYYVMFGIVSMAISRQIEQSFEMGGEKYAVGLVSGDRLLGSVLIVLKNEKPLLHQNLIEIYLRQASIALAQRLDADALRRNEERFRGIIEDQTDFIARFLPDGTLTFVNAPLCRAAGLDQKELTGRSFFTLVPADDRQVLVDSLRSLSAENPKMTARLRFIDRQGRTRWIGWTYRAACNDQGIVVEYDGTGRDITDLHEAMTRICSHHTDIQFLTEYSHTLAGLRSPEEIMAFTAKSLHSVLPDSLVAICSYAPSRHQLSFRCLEGNPEDLRILNHELGSDLTGTPFAFDADPDIRSLMVSSRIVQAPGTMSFFLSRGTEDPIARITGPCHFGRSYVMGLLSSDGTIDTVLLQLKSDGNLQKRELFEAVITQAGLALARVQHR